MDTEELSSSLQAQKDRLCNNLLSPGLLEGNCWARLLRQCLRTECGQDAFLHEYAQRTSLAQETYKVSQGSAQVTG